MNLKRTIEQHIARELNHPIRDARHNIATNVEPGRNVRIPNVSLVITDPAPSRGDSLAPLKAIVSQIDGAVSRIEVNRLKTAQLQMEGQQLLRFDLPIATPGGHRSIGFEIERDADAQRDIETEGFVVNLQIPVSENEEIVARIHWRDGTTSIRLWSDSQKVRNCINDFQHLLLNALERQGIENAIIALPPGDYGSHRVRDRRTLIDTSA